MLGHGDLTAPGVEVACLGSLFACPVGVDLPLGLTGLWCGERRVRLVAMTSMRLSVRHQVALFGMRGVGPERAEKRSDALLPI